MRKDYYVPQVEELLIESEGNVLAGMSDGGEGGGEGGGPDAPMRRYSPAAH